MQKTTSGDFCRVVFVDVNCGDLCVHFHRSCCQLTWIITWVSLKLIKIMHCGTSHTVCQQEAYVRRILKGQMYPMHKVDCKCKSLGQVSRSCTPASHQLIAPLTGCLLSCSSLAHQAECIKAALSAKSDFIGDLLCLLSECLFSWMWECFLSISCRVKCGPRVLLHSPCS